MALNDWSSKDSLDIMNTQHAQYFPKFSHFYQIQQYSRCATLIRQVQEKSTKDHSPIPTYYNAQYMLLLGVCEPEDKAALSTNVHAVNAFQAAFKDSPGLTRDVHMLIERLAFISELVQVHLGGIDDGGEHRRYMDKNMEEWLRGKTLKELGLEAFMVHYALLEYTRKKIATAAERSNHWLANCREVGEHLKVKPLVQQGESGGHIAKGTDQLSPAGTHAELPASPITTGISTSGDLSKGGISMDTAGLEDVNPNDNDVEMTEGKDFSVKRLEPASKNSMKIWPVPPAKYRRDYTEALSWTELEEVRLRRKNLIADTSDSEECMTPSDSLSPDEQPMEAPQEPPGDVDPILGEIQSILEHMELEKA
ncbi:hypothetical protein ONS95_010883 [Cadophora gregata]|uniref:uncharacterized protein n=1 Tax=Cadophora gregata TaxID=51156 RepID=UPI0026DBD7D7|nr:uncharacterized protein ONS95_010883 [Cadophora gregata]KAK0119431.1 hypothetical protein ONS95_010883 [Cadophora gregata]KAK0120471.1 hypothetical protein ONS96_010682 [Cadophora gregata f. sp. sojae]